MTKIKFQYTEMPIYIEAVGDQVDRKVTLCSVLNDDKLVSGYAVFNPVDNYSKRLGRKIALTKAIESLDRETRKGIWKEFLERHKL